MIISSAIKFHIDKTNEDVILCGLRHDDIFMQLKALGFQPKQGYTEIQQGFIDHQNNFLSREEAYIYAKICGQLSKTIIQEKDKKNCRILYSEDLW